MISSRSPRVVLAVGRAPSPTSVLRGVLERLRAHGVRATCVRADDAAEVPDADLLLLKDLAPAVLRGLTDRPACNPAPATLRCRDKAAVVDDLAAAGLPVPATSLVSAWAEVRALTAGRRAVVKPRSGEQGHGVLLLDGAAPPEPPAPGPWLVQERALGDGLDRKLYVIGDRVLGVRRSWPAPPDRRGSAYRVPEGVRVVAVAAARALGLEVCGLDVVETAQGPVVVDVNAFPGFKGVPGAAETLTAHVLHRLATGEVASCA